jgi:hypothetical protein
VVVRMSSGLGEAGKQSELGFFEQVAFGLGLGTVRGLSQATLRLLSTIRSDKGHSTPRQTNSPNQVVYQQTVSRRRGRVATKKSLQVGCAAGHTNAAVEQMRSRCVNRQNIVVKLRTRPLNAIATAKTAIAATDSC